MQHNKTHDEKYLIRKNKFKLKSIYIRSQKDIKVPVSVQNKLLVHTTEKKRRVVRGTKGTLVGFQFHLFFLSSDRFMVQCNVYSQYMRQLIC